MNDSQSKTVAIVLSTVGVLFMISIGFGFLPWNIAVFAGIACFVLAGMLRKITSTKQ